MLFRSGHDVRVVTLAQNGHSHEENGILYVGSISAERVYPGVRISAAGALPISHWLDELEAWGPEVIHTQSEFSTFMLAQRVARRCHCPVVHTYHTVYDDYTQYLFFSERLGRMTAEKAIRILSGYCSLMLAPTEKVRAMLNRYGVSCPVVTVPTGIDLTAFGPAKDNGEEKARMRAELGIPEGDTVLLSLGRLAAEKNHAQLVRLLAAQPEQSRPWLVFVGDGPARPDLEALTKELKLTDRVRFVGMVKPDEVPRWYRVGDIFVSASQSETQGKYRTANLSAGNTLCWFGASCFGKWGILPAGSRNPTCPPVSADRREQAAADISGRRKLSGRHGICTDSVLAAAVCAGNRIQAGNYFSGSGSAVYDGRCLLMNETARKLMKRIDDASFAMDDVILYLDTHPDDRNALNYYRYVVALRKEAVKAYEASFGPLTIEDADDACTWSWLTERWPWEGEV